MARAKGKWKERMITKAANLSVRNIVVEADGSLFVALEEYYSITTTYYDSRGGSRSTTTYYYEDILGAKNKQNRQFWMAQKSAEKTKRNQRKRDHELQKQVSDATGYYFCF